VIDLLNQQLADTLDLYTQTKQAHWNIKGIEFFQLHELFDKLAELIFPFIDLIAERITALGGAAMGTARMSAQNSTLPEYPADALQGRDHLEALTERWAGYARSTRTGINECDDANDQASMDMLTEVVREVDKGLYFLESHLQNAPE
jgi:starvation-inducible DNA-binding protein